MYIFIHMRTFTDQIQSSCYILTINLQDVQRCKPVRIIIKRTTLPSHLHFKLSPSGGRYRWARDITIFLIMFSVSWAPLCSKAQRTCSDVWFHHVMEEGWACAICSTAGKYHCSESDWTGHRYPELVKADQLGCCIAQMQLCEQMYCCYVLEDEPARSKL